MRVKPLHMKLCVYSSLISNVLGCGFQAGYVGVLQGAERFDHTRGYKFSTYVQYWIRKSMSMMVSRHARGVHIPVCAFLIFFKRLLFGFLSSVSFLTKPKKLTCVSLTVAVYFGRRQ